MKNEISIGEVVLVHLHTVLSLLGLSHELPAFLSAHKHFVVRKRGLLVEMAEVDIEEFIEQNRHLAELVDTYRGISESEKHWKARREFLFRNINDFEDPHIDQLLALSMVWANNVFLGCRYSPDLLEKMKEMAEGIVVEDAPVFKTRDEVMKNQKR
ncbi:CDKN2AIP N-terminal-like protein [Coregonus clupeaformis]|uniref:CDKN2AIP N-terminal-like protein n=1 Tax=Coregonus clupeaformis TaxID=59861 RepID=UPI001BE039E3|nr:CDKN2AIP N-terminal-like protein [Coregonus clupeaformis]